MTEQLQNSKPLADFFSLLLPNCHSEITIVPDHSCGRSHSQYLSSSNQRRSKADRWTNSVLPTQRDRSPSPPRSSRWDCQENKEVATVVPFQQQQSLPPVRPTRRNSAFYGEEGTSKLTKHTAPCPSKRLQTMSVPKALRVLPY